MIPHNRPTLDEDDVASVIGVLRNGHIAQGPQVRAFEEEVASVCGRPGWDGVAVSSGTAALYLGLCCLGVGVGDHVVVPTYVCSALLHAVRFAGAQPIVSDVRESDFNLDPSCITGGERVKAIILPHVFGVPSDPAALSHLGAPIIEDAAQAIGARLGRRPAGSLGDLAVFSFHATKPLTCGQGGMILGPREACDEIRDRREYDGKREWKPRFNFQMTDIQAALGRSQFRRLDDLLARRRETAALYAEALPRHFATQRHLPTVESNNFRFVIRLQLVREARERFKRAGIATIVPTEPWELLHRQIDLPAASYPVAERLASTTLSVPMQPSLRDDEKRRVASVIESLADLQ